jgi:pimeloyl-ACP methyl ester carboxylesterase
MHTSRRWAAVLAVLVVAATMGGTVALTPAGAASKPVAVFAKAGPYAVGVTTLTIGDRTTEVWYPASKQSVRGKTKDAYNIAKYLPQGLQDLLTSKNVSAPFTTDAYRDVPASAEGPFPLVVFSHGVGAYREQSSFLTTHLASWGFVVTSPDFLERGLGSMLGVPVATPRTDDDIVNAAVVATRAAFPETVRKGKIAIVGHSAGGGTAIQYARHSNVLTYIAMSAGPFAFGSRAAPVPAKKPSMYITGRQDGLAKFSRVATAYKTVPAPKRFIAIDGSGHLTALTDICEIGKGGGGIVAIALQAGIPVPAKLQRLGTDGCNPPAVKSKQVWPVTRHFVTAQLRFAFRIDKTPIGLQPSVVKAFLPAKVTYAQTLKK